MTSINTPAAESIKARIVQLISQLGTAFEDDADQILAEYVVIPRGELPEVVEGGGSNGFCTALAQEFYQPQLAFHPADGDVPAEWNRKIAYANLAVAEAVDARNHSQATRRDELAREAVPEYTIDGPNPTTYASLHPGIRKLVDRIIELESRS